ncbi:signal peptidase I [Flavobacterium stagni]|uniref:Signal peptidase I n=1 Tax=Flavobacterium stagni TaxID=2506421 RepID=A0A4Q1K9N1_9FLAO|nr:signal peptidase I [Flavobacterium stagni]RXR22603.1 signal peptidase I [Flavobacterium stagni]
MNLSQWLLFILVIQLIHAAGTWKFYVKAGRKAWEAAVPLYNAIVLLKIIKRPTWWTVLLFIPIINLILFPVIWVETLRSFGKKSTADTALAVFTLGFYLYYVNYTQELVYREDRSLHPETKTGETVSSILFAVVVATFVHTYFIQPFTIPTSSLEKSLLIGDFLFVSKFHYGARVPNTTVAAPMVHDTIPFIKTKSYLYDNENPDSWKNKFELPYLRFPGFESVKNNDIVVFNWPADTVAKFFTKDRRYLKPVDKKSNYVKRCVGIAGDSLQIKDGDVFVNGNKLILPERAKPQFSYEVAYDHNQLSDLTPFLDQNDITDGGYFKNNDAKSDTLYVMAMTDKAAANMRSFPGVKSVTKMISKKPDLSVFPQTKPWNMDNFGPIYIPKAGATVKLDLTTLPFYKKIIRDYEHNTLEVKNGEILINGKPSSTYTFQQNYYWMMGDNRHRSEDSRFWGYVPEDHIVGKPIFIWMSIKNFDKGFKEWRIRWDRLFTTVSGDGEPQSYFKYFLVLLGLYFVGEYYWKKRKNKSES